MSVRLPRDNRPVSTENSVSDPSNDPALRSSLRRTVMLVALLNLAYCVIETIVALGIG